MKIDNVRLPDDEYSKLFHIAEEENAEDREAFLKWALTVRVQSAVLHLIKHEVFEVRTRKGKKGPYRQYRRRPGIQCVPEVSSHLAKLQSAVLHLIKHEVFEVRTHKVKKGP